MVHAMPKQEHKIFEIADFRMAHVKNVNFKSANYD